MLQSSKDFKQPAKHFHQMYRIEHEFNGMMLIEHEESQKSQNLDELFDFLTENKTDDTNSKIDMEDSPLKVSQSMYKKRSKKLIKRKKPLRQDNAITSNTVRLLKLCVKQAFSSQRHIYGSFTKFFSWYSIRSQIWAFDAILVYILYLRDETGDINLQRFLKLSSLIQSRLLMIERRANNELIKERIARYRSHCQLFFHENRSFKKLSHIEDEMQGFFSSLVSKKKLVTIRSLEYVQKIIRSIAIRHLSWKSTIRAPKTQKQLTKAPTIDKSHSLEN